MNKLHHFIGGEKRLGKSERYGSIYNPSTGEETALCPYASTEEVNVAVDLADKAAKDWKRVAVGRRMEVFIQFRSLLVDATEELAVVIGQENGKTITGAKGEISRAIEAVDFQ